MVEYLQTRLTAETDLVVSSLTPYTVYHVTVAGIPALPGAEGQLVPRGFWSEAASTDARTLPDGKNSDDWQLSSVITCVVLDQELISRRYLSCLLLLDRPSSSKPKAPSFQIGWG